MKNLRLSIRVSENEMEKLKDHAQKMDMQIAEFVRQKLFGDSVEVEPEVEELFHQAFDLIEKIPPGAEFTIKQLFQMFSSWDTIPRPLRILLGKYFNKMVESKQIGNVQRIEKKVANVQVYRKI